MSNKFNIANVLVGVVSIIAVIFLTAYFYGWNQNAAHSGKYDLAGLVDTAKWTMGQLIALFSSHSLLNTPIPWLQKADEIAK